jgi:hypothetical protein
MKIDSLECLYRIEIRIQCGPEGGPDSLTGRKLKEVKSKIATTSNNNIEFPKSKNYST